MIEGTPSSEQNLISVGEDMRFDCTRRNCGGHTIVSLDNIKQYANYCKTNSKFAYVKI